MLLLLLLLVIDLVKRMAVAGLRRICSDSAQQAAWKNKWRSGSTPRAVVPAEVDQCRPVEVAMLDS